MVFGSFGRFLFVFVFVSYPLGHILESAFLWHVYVDRNLPVDLFGSKSGSGAVPRMVVFMMQVDM